MEPSDAPGGNRAETPVSSQAETPVGNQAVTPVGSQADFRPGDYLTFRLARRHFAIDATRVRGILSAHELIPCPEPTILDPPGMVGVATMGGLDLPVIDLREKLGLVHTTNGRFPCVVVVEVRTSLGPRTAGFLVDRVSEVLRTRSRDFRLGKLRIGRPRVILDPDLLLAPAPVDGLREELSVSLDRNENVA